MKGAFLLVFVFYFAEAFAWTIPDEYPPADENEGEWAVIPDENDQFYRIKVEDAMKQPVPFFNVNNDVKFDLYTLLNPKVPQIINLHNVSSIKQSNFNPNLPTRIVIHGWYTKGALARIFTDAYFKKRNLNINCIVVDWGAGANTINYIAARRRVKPVGLQVGKFIDFLVIDGGMKLTDLMIIGHSLGAHVGGFAGKNVKTGKLPKIVALDPALPLFGSSKAHERLDAADAEYVEVIHTNAGYLGFRRPLGHVSFYPNGGTAQPGCGWDLFSLCAHSRAYLYYIESIHSDVQFYAYKCESSEQLRQEQCNVLSDVVKMGGEPGNQGLGNGTYYLRTNGKTLFARGLPESKEALYPKFRMTVDTLGDKLTNQKLSR